MMSVDLPAGPSARTRHGMRTSSDCEVCAISGAVTDDVVDASC
ncbi:Uncharacterised protein [Mycobacteroides abscessus subsp. abscessus]|nr:Uncharacterised protein [Mycobacteroides abscessus subsp. abscessus]